MAKRKKKTRAHKRRTTRTSTKRGPELHDLSTAALQAEIRRRNREVDTLQRRREKLLNDLAGVDEKIRAYGLMAGGGGLRKRPRNEMNLVDSLHKVLTGKTMSVTDAAEAVQRAGYLTTSANFRTIVNQTLIKNRKKFKKVSRGQYTAA